MMRMLFVNVSVFSSITSYFVAAAVAKYPFKNQLRVHLRLLSSHMSEKHQFKEGDAHFAGGGWCFLKSWLKIEEWNVLRLALTTDIPSISVCEL